MGRNSKRIAAYEELASVAESSANGTPSIAESEGGWSSTEEDDLSVDVEIPPDGYQLDTSAFVIITANKKTSPLLPEPLFGESRHQQGGVHLILSLMQKHKASNKMKPSSLEAAGGTIGSIVSIMMEHPSHTRTQAVGCQVLQHLASFRNNRSNILSAGGTEALVSAMNNHMDQPVIQESCCWALEMLSRRAKHRDMLDAKTVTETITSSLSNSQDNAGIHRRGFAALVNLAKSPTNIDFIAANWGVSKSISSLMFHKCYSPVVKLALELLACLCRGNEDSGASSLTNSSEGCSVIVQSIRCHGHDCPSVLKFGIELLAIIAMRMLALTGLSFKVNFSKVRGDWSAVDGTSNKAEQVISIMHSANRVPYIQQCASLEHHSETSTEYSSGSVMSIINKVTVDAVVSAMKQLGYHPNLQMNACIILASIAASGNAYDIVEAGGLEAIIQLMKAHSVHRGVQKNALVALANLWTADCGLARTNGQDALGTIMDTMYAYEDDEHIQIGCQAIHHFVFQNETAFNKYPAPEFVRVITAGMRSSNNPLVQEKGCMALACIALLDSGDVAICEAGGIEAIISAIKNYSEFESTLVGGLMALLNLSIHESNRVSILSVNGTMEVLLSAMDDHELSPRVLGMAIPLLHNMALERVFSRSDAALLCVRFVVKTMKSQRSHLSIQETCCELLWALSHEHDNRRVITDMGCIETLVRMLHTSSSATLARATCFTLSILAEDQNNKATITELGGLDALLTAMGNFHDKADVQCCCMMLLSLLSELNTNRNLVAKAGGVRASLTACRSYDLPASLQILGRSVLFRCSLLVLMELDWCDPQSYISFSNGALVFMLVWSCVDVMVTSVLIPSP